MIPPHRVGTAKVLASGFFGGIAIGALARLWMRWISTDPEFSWSGTFFIVIVFTIFFTTQSIVAVLRRRLQSRRATTIVRVLGVIFSLPVFSGAGGLMLPTVAIASVFLWTKLFKKVGRRATIVKILLLGLALLVPITVVRGIISDFGWTFSTLGRAFVFFSVYGLVIVGTRPTLRPLIDANSVPRQFGKVQKVLLSIGISIVLLLLMVGTVGIPFKT